jgi:hypothetical protein
MYRTVILHRAVFAISSIVLVASVASPAASVDAQKPAQWRSPAPGVQSAVRLNAPSPAPAAPTARSAYDTAVLDDRPVGFWHDDLGTDVVGGRNATRVGGPGTATLPNGDTAPRFDGSRKYLEVADNNRWSLDTTGILTIEAWVRPSTLRFISAEKGKCYVHWLGKGITGQHEWTLRMYSDLVPTPCASDQRTNRVSVYAFNPDGGLGTGAYFQGGLDNVPVMKAGRWIHVVGIVNTRSKSDAFPNGYVRIYRNGHLVNTRDLFSTVRVVPVNGTAPVRIGTRDFNSFFQGSIGKVALYDHEVLGKRLRAHYDIMWAR